MDDLKFTLFDAMLYAMEGDDPSKAIDNMEKRGQRQIIRDSNKLPKKHNLISLPNEIKYLNLNDSMSNEERYKVIEKNNIDYTKSQYEKMGISIVDSYDELFWNVVLPKGWRIDPSGTYWNYLIDNKGRRRAQFFYKAVIYDRDAFVNFEKRFRISIDHTLKLQDVSFEEWEKSDYIGTVLDGDKVIFKTEQIRSDTFSEDDAKKILRDKLNKFMAENYPDYDNIDAYWD